MKEIILEHPIHHDEYTAAAEQMFDVPHLDKSVTTVTDNIQPPDDWNIGLIYGPSGSGKSTLLKSLGHIGSYWWSDDRSVISQFTPMKPEEVTALFSAVGFNTVPAWLRPFRMLSNGEQFRCNLARALVSSVSLILIDEFTSVVDRNVAMSASNAVQKYIRARGLKVIFASCHADIIPLLRPDWMYNPSEAITRYVSKEKKDDGKPYLKYSEQNMKLGSFVNSLSIQI